MKGIQSAEHNQRKSHPILFTTQCYASAVYAVVMCPSVCPSQAGTVSKRLDESSWVMARRLSSTHATLCYKEIWVTASLGYSVLPSGTVQNSRISAVGLTLVLARQQFFCARHCSMRNVYEPRLTSSTSSLASPERHFTRRQLVRQTWSRRSWS